MSKKGMNTDYLKIVQFEI